VNADKRGSIRSGHAGHVCNVCGKTSENTICEACSQRIRLEALARKKHEESGDAWTHWEKDPRPG
jgi:hypothetical protein